MLLCPECGGVLDVIRIESPPDYLSKQEKLVYNRLCDVKCLNCGKIFYSQPYDFGKKINIVREI